MRIFTDPKTNLYINAISQLSDGTKTNGQVFDIVSGPAHAQLNFNKDINIKGAINDITLNALMAVLSHVNVDSSKGEALEGEEPVTTETYKEVNAGHEVVVTHSSYDDVPPGHYYLVRSTGYVCTIEFQNGPISTEGVNGLTNEVLLAILIHRTEALDAQYPCDENKEGIEHMKKALEAFNKRTANRKARGVADQLIK